MKKFMLFFLFILLILGISSITFAGTTDEETVLLEESSTVEEEVVEEDTFEDSSTDFPIEGTCPHMWGEWYYDMTEHEDGSCTFFRTCECGAYEELSEQQYLDSGGQYEDCDKERHYNCEEENILYCEECNYKEEER